jgi:hypothetical protein
MAPRPPTVIMVMGLQGSGKTTSVAKLGRHFQHEGFRPLLVAADVYRPAAIEQLSVLGKELGQVSSRTGQIGQVRHPVISFGLPTPPKVSASQGSSSGERHRRSKERAATRVDQ